MHDPWLQYSRISRDDGDDDGNEHRDPSEGTMLLSLDHSTSVVDVLVAAVAQDDI